MQSQYKFQLTEPVQHRAKVRVGSVFCPLVQQDRMRTGYILGHAAAEFLLGYRTGFLVEVLINLLQSLNDYPALFLCFAAVWVPSASSAMSAALGFVSKY